MKKFTSTILIIVVEFLVSTTQAQNLQFAKTFQEGWSFIENKGQLADAKGNLLPDIKYYGRDKGVNIYCRQQMLSFVFTKITYKEKANTCNKLSSKFDATEIDKADYERMDMRLIGSNANAPIIASGQKEAYLNFYLAHTPEQGITNVHQFEKLTYKNIYNKIDLILYVKDQGMKYEFIIHPGGKVDNIKIKWEGATTELLSNGSIKYSNHLGFIDESAPFSFLSSGEKVESRFHKNKDGSIYFETDTYELSNTLVIDPTFKWGTYFGGSASDYGIDIKTDSSGNVFVSGETTSTSGIATTGAYQTSIGGSRDAYFAKFDNYGSIKWATYFGGSDNDFANGVAVKDSDLFITGYTKSTSGIATSGAYQTANAGGNDVFIAKFTTGGSIVWATYYGGTGTDEGWAIDLDNSANVYVSGRTYSSSGIATSGSYQTSLAGNADVFIAKFDNKGGRVWASYFGGPEIENSIGMTIDTTGSVCIIGFTKSTSGISTSGAHQTSYGGGVNDAFISKFNNSGTNLSWATYYGGSGNEYGYGIESDLSGNIFISGKTNSSSSIASSGAYQTSYGGGSYDVFFGVFGSSGNRVWVTYYGGSGDEEWGPIVPTNGGTIYVLGGTTSTSGIATSGAYQTSIGGKGDLFLVKFNTNGNRLYGTYYGGTEGEGMGGLTIDISNNIYFAGNTSSTSGIASTGGYQTTYGGGSSDAFIVKFSDCKSTDSTIIKAVCDSFILNKITYKTSGSYKQYLTNAVNCDSTLTLKLTVKKTFATLIKTECDSFAYYGTTYKTSGTFIQKITNKAGCDSLVTLKLLIKYRKDTTITKVSCSSYTLNTVTYDSSGIYMQKLANVRGCDSLITLNLTITKPTDTTLKVTACNSYVLNGQTYSSTGIYTQILTNAANCDSTITLNLTIKESTASTLTQTACNSFLLNGTTYNSSGTFIQTLTNKAGCDSTLTLKLTINKSTSSTINQTACDQFVLNGTTYNKGGTYTQMLTNKKGCDSTITLNLTINQNPEAYFSAIINKNKVTFTPKDMNVKNYAWEFGDGGTSTQKSPVYTYPSIGNYTVKLKITSNEDCENENDTTISIQSVGDIAKNIKKGITLFPNPAKGEVTILGLTEPTLIRLMDAKGKLIAEMESSKIYKLNTMDLSKGIYLINISNEQMNLTKKLVIE